uniref:MFS transporter n=1 Tax=Cyberlindnera americana TaxID=36016 RepID=A0A5P8N8M5_9ASCO|nr:MFS transporter [Cyberlindnera americana]
MSSTKSSESSLIKDHENKIPQDVKVAEITDMEAQPILSTIISPSGKVIDVPTEPGYTVDEAFALAKEYEDVDIHPEADAKLRRKLDWTLLPIFGFLYMVQFMDKTCISFAAIMGIRTDYNMVGQMYSWTTSGFYLAYLVASPFAAVTLQKLPAVRVSSICIVLWGLIQCLLCVTKSYATFMLLRVLLGMLEAFVSPIFVIILNQYYRKSEHFGRSAYFYGFNGLGSIFLAGVSSGLYQHKDSYSISAYHILFIIIGLMTIIVGFVIMLVVPTTPDQSRWLSEEEKAMVIARIRGNQQGFGSKKYKVEQVWECLSDVRTWLYFLIAICVAIPNGGVASFTTIIIKSFGYSTSEALWMKAPTGAFELVFLCTLPWTMKICSSRLLVTNIYFCIVLMAVCLLAFGSNNAALAGIWIFGISPVGIAAVSSCVTSNTAGFTKKLTANALSLMAYSAGNIIGPQTFQSSDAPNYHKAKGTCVGCYSACIVLVSILAYLNIRENKKRDRQKAELGDKYTVVQNQEFADLTDFQNPEFRYAY